MKGKLVIAVLTAIIGIYIYGCNIDGKEAGLNNINYFKPVTLSVDERSHISRYFAKDKVRSLDSLTNIYFRGYSFNGAIMVVEDGKILYEKYNGYERLNSGNPINRSSRFQLASVSKQFTAVAIMMLHEQGLLDYDNPVIDYIPELPYGNITIRQLLTHTSGLPNYMWLVERHWKESLSPYNEEIICLLQRHNLPLYFRPGSRYNYSNTGYVLLASVVERITGLYYSEFLDQNIFIPLGMENSFVYSTAFETEYPDKIEGYRAGRRGRFYMVPDDPHDGAVGDKGIYSNVYDLFLWDQALENELLIDNATIQYAFKPVRLNNGHTFNYGFGWRIVDNEGPYLTYHNGLWQGFRTSFRRYNRDNKSIFILTNNNYILINRLADDIRDIIFIPTQPVATEMIVDILVQKGIHEAAKKYKELKNIHSQNILFGREHLIVLAGLFMDINKPVMVDMTFNLSDYLYDNEDGNEIVINWQNSSFDR